MCTHLYYIYNNNNNNNNNNNIIVLIYGSLMPFNFFVSKHKSIIVSYIPPSKAVSNIPYFIILSK